MRKRGEGGREKAQGDTLRVTKVLPLCVHTSTQLPHLECWVWCLAMLASAIAISSSAAFFGRLLRALGLEREQRRERQRRHQSKREENGGEPCLFGALPAANIQERTIVTAITPRTLAEPFFLLLSSLTMPG